MKKFFTLKLLLLIAVLSFGALRGSAQVAGDFQTKNTGNWSDFNAWNVRNATNTAWVAAVAGQLPTATTSVFVQPAQTITIDNAAAVCNDLNVNGDNASKISFSAAGVLNVKGNMILFNTSPNCFGVWAAGAKIVFSGSGAQGFTNLSVLSVFVNIEVNKPSGTLTTSSNFRFGSFTLTAGNFTVGSGSEIQGTSGTSTININGGTWIQNMSTTKINNSGTQMSPIGALTINAGSMILGTSNTTGGFQFSSLSVINGGVLTFQRISASGLFTIGTSINIDATSTFNTALSTTTLPGSVTFSGLVNYNNVGAQNISPATYSHLQLSGTGLKTLGGPVIIPANGTLEMSGIATSPTLALGTGSLTVSNNATNLIYSSTGAQTATSTEWDPNFQNITVNNASGVSMAAGLVRTIFGSLNLTNGTLNIGNTGGGLTLDGASLNRTLGFINGTNTSDLTITGATGGTVLLPIAANISLRNVTISGTRALQMDGLKSINLSGLFNIAASATYDNGGESQIVDNSGGSISISGKFINRDKDNFTGTGGAIPGIAPTLNANCTVEYGLAGDQVVTSRSDYQNIIFSGSGIKSVPAFTPTGTLTITGSAIVDASANNIGDGVVGKTNFTMDGGRLILGTTGTQPMMVGIYNLTGGVVQFNSSQAIRQNILSGKEFYNVEVTGNNVGNSSGNLLIGSGGSFTVKTNAKFIINADQIAGATGTQTLTVESNAEFDCGNADGFSGGNGSVGNSTSIKSDIETIILSLGSIINYSRANPQTITNQIPYQNLTISGTGNKTAPAGTLTIDGNFTKTSSTFLHNNGTVLFDGGATAQGYSTNAEVLFNNVINNNLNTTTGLSINNDMAILGQLTLNANSKLNLAIGNITLKSSAAATANVAAIPASASIMYGTGAFTVERYIQAVRAWRFLAIPLNSSTAIHENWQENQAAGSPTPVGFGTQLSTDDVLAAGFDFVTTAPGTGPGLKTYDALTNKYVGVSSTLATFDPSLGGYMTFIRGDRTITGFSTTSTATTLRIKGPLFTGDHSPATILLNQTTPVNNPFASRIDLSKIDPLHQFTFYIWDPTLGGTQYGVGAIRTIIWDGVSAYIISPAGGYTGSVGYIESGQAFFARDGFSNGNLLMDETVKSGGSALVSAPVSSAQQAPQLQTNLYAIEDGNAVLKDGILSSFDDTYNNAIDGADAVKFANFNENLSISREGKLLEIERRHSIVQSDTIFLNLSGLRLDHYRFEIVATALNTNGLTGFVEDNYLHTKTALDLTRSTFIDFSIDAEEGSSASNRFRIVMNAPEAGPLPVTVTNVKAYVQNASIALEWKVVNESGIQQYEIEKSVDGIHFQKAGSVAAKNLPVNNYQWLDDHAVVGYNYYRIRIVNVDGKINYTNVVKVFVDKLKSLISVYPNPIQNGIINLRLVNQPAGAYHVRLLNKLGQNILSKQINHAEGTSIEHIQLNDNLAHDLYQLEVVQPGGTKKHLNILY